MTSILPVVLTVALGVGCAHDVHTKMPTGPGEETGTITIVLTQAAHDLTVVVDGVLVVERAHTKKARIEVSDGYHDVLIAAGSGNARIERHVEVSVDAGKDIAIPLGSPETSMGTRNMWLGALTSVGYLTARVLYDVFVR